MAGPSPFELFPLGVATGRAHCNRTREREELARNVLGGVHTWLWARRRMGKTSLVEQVVQDLGREVVAGKIDLLVVHDARELEERIRGCIERLGSRLAPRGRPSAAKLAKAFGELKPEVSIGVSGLGLKLAAPARIAEGIAEMLLGLDRAAGLYRRRVVLVFDEFQQLGPLASGTAPRSLEGAVRHAAERAKNVTYLFSGSQRHLLASLFEEADRPLYRLCRKMSLERIGAEDYRGFLRRAARSRWRVRMADETIGRILALTGRHPHYVNALCARLWSEEQPPDPAAVGSAWSRIVGEEANAIAGRVVRLAPSQRALLRAIARAEEGVEHPISLEFLSPLRLPASTGGRAKEVLEREDLIRQDGTGRWTLVDPAMAAFLRGLQ